MKNSGKFRTLSITAMGLAIAATSLLAGCYAGPPPRPREVIVAEPAVVLRPPPPMREERIPPPPSERVVWDPGHWQWNGRDYAWIAGHYVEKPYREAVWEPGHWVERNGGWVWDPGHWQQR